MKENKKKLVIKLIEEEGVQGALELFRDSLSDFADQMSDDGIKEKAYEAADLVDVLDAMVLAKDDGLDLSLLRSDGDTSF